MERSCARAGCPQPHNPAAIGIHRTGTAETHPPGRAGLGVRRLDARAWRNLGAAGLGWFLFIAFVLTGWFVVVVPLRADILDNDLTFVYIGARIGLEHGWSHLYSLSLQHQLFAQLRPHAVFNDDEWFVSPPPFAWLVLPLSGFGAAGAVYAWLAISLAALGVAWLLCFPLSPHPCGTSPLRTRPARHLIAPLRGEGAFAWLWLLGALAWYPVLYGLRLAQPDLLILALVAAAWRLADAEKPYLAGAVLGLSVIKPQLTLFLPLVLLASGRWRIAVGWAVSAGLLAAASAALIGGQGLSDYVNLLNQARHVTNNRYFTLAFVLGPDTPGYSWPRRSAPLTGTSRTSRSWLSRPGSSGAKSCPLGSVGGCSLSRSRPNSPGR
ncbi:MAG: DUF2029 domain-containing protein [Chloroflexi bacterium]|nr:MAG: DUF2029 domain-containing protein [Chloroflexota bacterium]